MPAIAPPVAAPARLAALLQLTDSALPTGAFSHSFGLESYLDAGEAASEEQLLDWLRGYLATQLTLTDAAAVRRACRFAAASAAGEGSGASDPSCFDAELARLDAELSALLVPRQIRSASTRMGRRLLEIAAHSFPSPGIDRYAAAVREGDCAGHYTVAFALAGVGQGIEEELLVEAYLHSALASLIANAVRAIPLGQLAGQRVLAALRVELPGAAARSRTVGEFDFGAAAPALEIHQMRHEHLHARMFAS